MTYTIYFRIKILRILSFLWEIFPVNSFKDFLLLIANKIASQDFIYQFTSKDGPIVTLSLPEDISWIKYALSREYEKCSILFLKKFALNFPGTYIDVGSNIGWFSLCMLYSNEDNIVHSFEPQSRIYDRLVKNISINNFSDRIVANKVGLSSGFSDKKNIYNMPNDPHGHAFVEFKEGAEVIDIIELWSMDYYIDKEKIRDLKFIKIDVEGHELDVIKGSLNSIQSWSPVIMFEAKINGRITNRFYEIFNLVTSINGNYKLYKIPEFKGKIIEVKNLDSRCNLEDELLNYTNLLFVSNKYLPHLTSWFK
jgi:FkbM family methyltransferase